MSNHDQNTKPMPLNADKTQMNEFNIAAFFRYLQECNYSARQISKLKSGLTHMQIVVLTKNLIPHLADDKYLRELGSRLRHNLSADKAKNALTCARRMRDFALVSGLIERSENLRTDGYFGEIERRFRRFLDVERQLSAEHSKRHVREYYFLTEFLKRLGNTKFEGIDHQVIFKFVSERAPCISSIHCIRTLLGYLYREGHVSSDYTPLIISSRNKRNEVRKFLPVDDVENLLGTIETSSVEGKRCLAFFLLIARLGLRGREILRLEIDDIDWEKGRISIDGKHARMTSMPFSDEVGQAILDYLKHSERLFDAHIFVSLKPPYRGLTRTRPISEYLHTMYEISGVTQPTQDTTISVFRHSIGTAKLNSGKSILEVRDFMRHKDVATTMIYAKYNLASLQNLACDWPGMSS